MMTRFSENERERAIIGEREREREKERERERERVCEREIREIVVCRGKILECMYVCMYVCVSSFDRHQVAGIHRTVTRSSFT
jgi:hypothetical protein